MVWGERHLRWAKSSLGDVSVDFAARAESGAAADVPASLAL
eukprot:CAMPEP_0202846664 /NCGR_PEP_ID=MMETSP1389-20130828/73394_1 /ASSEMBLY_ACC=CAM_ASM_000865 /TAXON_ID=302021 /ORGANISM="Rhodomonas sp., Strain CCMP768" /LENGTH=40 /DNA_ID= /DNA_START= /DNA_END= /DNA_ORIENTATION=